MLALLDAVVWQVTLWTILGCIVVNIFIRVQVYFADPNHRQFCREWYKAFEDNRAVRYQDQALHWRCRDLREYWGAELNHGQPGAD